MRLNNKGQEFSVFQLIISAIVAVAVLGVLLTLMGTVIGPGKDPIDATKALVSSLIDKSGSLSKTDPVSFDKDKTISASAIADPISVDKGSICFSVGAYQPKFSTGATGNHLAYTGSTPFTVKIQAICASNGSDLTAAITDYQTADAAGKVLMTWPTPDELAASDWCPCRDASWTDKCCIIAPVKNS